MYIHCFSSIMTLLLTTLPTSLTAPPINSVSAGPLAVQCFPRMVGKRNIAPFPSHCRTLASNIRNIPNAGTPRIFDGRSEWPDQPHIPVPFTACFQTCKANFKPNGLDPSSRPGSNYATYTSFAGAIDTMINTCFTYGPGEESKDYVLAAATYTRDVAPLGTSKWLGGITGPNMPTQAGSANVTADGEGLDCTEIVESWASLNGTTSGLVNGESGLVNGESGLVNGESGTAEQGRVDVT